MLRSRRRTAGSDLVAEGELATHESDDVDGGAEAVEAIGEVEDIARDSDAHLPQ
jgi:hypothetical protein